MSDYFKNNIFERLGACVPGYKGYAEKEERRDTDKLLRLQIASQLDIAKNKIDSVILKEARENNHSSIIILDSIKMKLDSTANRIRYAPSGYAGFFDIVQIKNNDLNKLYEYDLTLLSLSTNIDNLIEDIKNSGGENTVDAVSSALSDFDLKIIGRDKAIEEI